MHGMHGSIRREHTVDLVEMGGFLILGGTCYVISRAYQFLTRWCMRRFLVRRPLLFCILLNRRTRSRGARLRERRAGRHRLHTPATLPPPNIATDTPSQLPTGLRHRHNAARYLLALRLPHASQHAQPPLRDPPQSAIRIQTLQRPGPEDVRPRGLHVYLYGPQEPLQYDDRINGRLVERQYHRSIVEYPETDIA